jgi:glycine dehydrogenase subunit 1
VYMSLLGPSGMRELAVANMQKSAYARKRIGAIPGVKAPVFAAPHFNEFLVNFDGTGKSVAAVNAALLERGILGGKDVSGEFPQFGQCALFCVTENHSQAEIDRLVSSLAEVTK